MVKKKKQKKKPYKSPRRNLQVGWLNLVVVKMDLISFQLLYTLNSAKYSLIIGLIVWRTFRILRSIYHFRSMVIRVRIAVQYTGEWNKRNNDSFWKTWLYALNYKALIVAKMFSNGSFIIFLNYFPIGRACIKKISNAHSFYVLVQLD